MSDRFGALKLLRRAIKIHLLLAGGPSPELCGILLKFPDVIESYFNHDLPDIELAAMAGVTIRELLGHIQERAISYQPSREMVKPAELTGYLVKAGERTARLELLAGKLEHAKQSLPAATEYHRAPSAGIPDLLGKIGAGIIALNDGLKELGTESGVTYPDLTTIEG
jgi:hypothetical protein